jgi:lipopolysaccharide/colanic/teichoic acid biosynthesis glycosyltransferase
LAAAILLIVFSPVMAIISTLIRREDRGPALFRQTRPGKDEAPFEVLKFRTMIVDADDHLDDEGRPTRQRVTRVGAALRTTSLDELPQLVNVLRGEMSLVGPRPTLMEYLPVFSEDQRIRFRMKPGLTGLAQVRGRTSVPMSQRLQMDSYYVRHFSLALDARILLETVSVVLRRRGTSTDRRPELDDVFRVHLKADGNRS